MPTAHVAQMSVHELHDTIERGEAITILDVRSRREFDQLHIDGAVHIPAPDLRTRSKELRMGLYYLHKLLSQYSRHPERAVEARFFYYGNLYVAQALFQEGGEYWDRWYVKVHDNLLSPRCFKTGIDSGSEGNQGYWESRYGNEYATAVSLLILELPLGYLPIFQR